MRPFWEVVSLLLLLLPLFYIWILILSFQGKTPVRPHQAFACLVIWLIQLPIVIVKGLGCIGGGCSGTGAIVQDLALVLVFDLVPFVWLLRKADS